ncbi:winged helix-turn-helix domain-containing protein [Nocardia alni]|uniref:winged helix-turn-helix domain-containing protein n=1 Tax=Nocardia alni TaxID=2815723 RepID=UPI001C242157|nr:winged helix-turn-helix domain-containing protein [Nocardia alni]
MGARTVVADVADELARRVVRGDYSPGELMPSVRRVAEEFETNRATAQLILGRLETQGFVEAHRGRGFAIRDVREEGGVEVYRRLFRLSMPCPELSSPELAVAIFGDIVEMERQIVHDVLASRTASARPRSAHAALAADIDILESLARQDDPDLPGLLAAEVALVRRLLSGPGYGMQRAVLNTIGEMIGEVPEAVAAYYVSGPGAHVLAWRSLAAVWDAGVPPSDIQVTLFEDLFARFHERVVDHFRVLLAERVGAFEPA